ncbi:MAG: hypothetical protein OXC58_04590 [Acidimicrobiaceae bacterium]|nr:hypothetical protein [Acidimicrobiaceae bacterium]
MATLEVLVGRVWLPLRQSSAAARVPESSTLEIRGFDSGETVMIGPRAVCADSTGRIELWLSQAEELRGHLGLVEVKRGSGALAGEFEVTPDKMSESSYRTLRAELEQMWTGLLFDASGVSRLKARLPSPAELWRMIEKPVREIAAEPRSVVARGEALRRLEAVRRPAELTASVIRASASLARMAGSAGSPDSDCSRPERSDPFGQTAQAARAAQAQRPGRATVLVRTADVPENALVAETLRRLAAYARRQPDGSEVATRASRALRRHPFDSCHSLRSGFETARLHTLHDARYRRIDQVLKMLDRPEAYATEGPGEARLGVEGMTRLYEYWVFLCVLEACRRRYGQPIDPGFEILGRATRSGVTRLEIPAGATVRFNGDVHVAFEPRITSSGSGWQQLENVPLPDHGMAQNTITPDVVVLRRTSAPAAVVFDAKYVGRHWVERKAAEIHARYSRVRLQGEPVVRQVLAMHPHAGIDYIWAGYGSVPMIPGTTADLTELLP